MMLTNEPTYLNVFQFSIAEVSEPPRRAATTAIISYTFWWIIQV